MATLILTAEEVAEVRLMAGVRLKTDDVPDALITGTMVLGAASDYVFEKVRESLDLDKLSATDRIIAERFADETDDDIANFVNTVLKPPQASQFRRAVLYRSVGNLIVAVQQVGEERAGLLSQNVSNATTGVGRISDWKAKRDHYYALADDELRLLDKAFTDDAFSRPKPADYSLMGII